MIDCALIVVPPVLVNGPLIGTASLKAYATHHGYTLKVINPSISLFKTCSKEIRDEWPYSKFTDEGDVDAWVDEALSYQPKVVGLSIFAWSGEPFLRRICENLRAKRPDLPLVLGGPGTTEVADHFLNDDLIDYYVVGDGEKPLLNILEGKFDHPNLNTKNLDPLTNDEFQVLPPPDYSDETQENMEFYQSRHNYVIYATGSKGCVFDCSFCNVPAMMKYRFKDPKKFARELKDIQVKYKPKFIELSDSIINGSLSAWRELITELAALNEKEPDSIPKLIAHFRVRSPKVAPEWEFELAAKAGFYRMKMGIESGSDQVRAHIGKDETDDDIFYTLRMLKKYNMVSTFLVIVGYPTETSADFEDSMNMLKRIKAEGLSDVVQKFVINELYISQGTRLMEQVEELGIVNVGNNADEKLDRPWMRVLPNGEVLDNEVRARRVKTMKDYVLKEFHEGTQHIITFASEDTSVVACE